MGNHPFAPHYMPQSPMRLELYQRPSNKCDLTQIPLNSTQPSSSILTEGLVAITQDTGDGCLCGGHVDLTHQGDMLRTSGFVSYTQTSDLSIDVCSTICRKLTQLEQEYTCLLAARSNGVIKRCLNWNVSKYSQCS